MMGVILIQSGAILVCRHGGRGVTSTVFPTDTIEDLTEAARLLGAWLDLQHERKQGSGETGERASGKVDGMPFQQILREFIGGSEFRRRGKPGIDTVGDAETL